MNRWLIWNVAFRLHEALKGHSTYRYLRDMEAADRLAASELDELCSTRVRDLIDYAWEHVPYIRMRMKEARVSVSDIFACGSGAPADHAKSRREAEPGVAALRHRGKAQVLHGHHQSPDIRFGQAPHCVTGGMPPANVAVVGCVGGGPGAGNLGIAGGTETAGRRAESQGRIPGEPVTVGVRVEWPDDVTVPRHSREQAIPAGVRDIRAQSICFASMRGRRGETSAVSESQWCLSRAKCSTNISGS